ncbi:hypothetical protein Taro_035132, partial [Colocasia esculenta]|nr:hypothetical protein [Colocasia esculenta]
WLTGARGKTFVREAELDRAENSGSGGDSREKASRGSAFIMAPRRRREWRVVVQTSQQEAGDAPPPPLAQSRPQDTHVGAAQAQPGPSRQVQQHTGSQSDSRVRRRFRRSRRLTEQRQLLVESVQQPGVQPQQQSQRPFCGRCYRLRAVAA